MPDQAKSSPEPSMEEIIASISRIITEEKNSDEASRGTSAQETDILELTEVVDEDGSIRRLTPSVGQSNAGAAAGTNAVHPVAADPGRAVGPELPRLQSSPDAKPETGPERIVSPETSGAVAAAFAQLGALPRERRRDAELPLGNAERTLEDLVRDLLRPLLQSWLDANLPGIVERLVREEIARVVGEAGYR